MRDTDKLAAAQSVTHYGMRPRVTQGPSNPSSRADGSCWECNAEPGQFHVPGCEGERCPACGRQGISCGCDIVRCGCGRDHTRRTVAS